MWLILCASRRRHIKFFTVFTIVVVIIWMHLEWKWWRVTQLIVRKLICYWCVGWHMKLSRFLVSKYDWYRKMQCIKKSSMFYKWVRKSFDFVCGETVTGHKILIWWCGLNGNLWEHKSPRSFARRFSGRFLLCVSKHVFTPIHLNRNKIAFQTL